MRKEFPAVFVICLFLGASATFSVGSNENSNDESLNTFIGQSRGSWVLGTYGDFTLEPPGSGNHYIYPLTSVNNWEAIYFTPPLDLSGLTMVNLTFAYSWTDLVGDGQSSVWSYSGGMNISNQEECFMFIDIDDGWPPGGQCLIMVSTINHNTEVSRGTV